MAETRAKVTRAGSDRCQRRAQLTYSAAGSEETNPTEKIERRHAQTLAAAGFEVVGGKLVYRGKP